MVRNPRLIDASLMDATTAAAQSSPRRRRNFNLHSNECDVSNRLLNAVEPGSYIPPHRHLDPTKDESFVVLRGRLGLLCFDADGKVTLKATMAAGTDVVGADIPMGIFHSLVSLEPGSLFFETKAGPYCAIADKERAPWAPHEGDPGAVAYLTWMESLFR